MKAYVITTLVGVFGIAEDKSLITARKFKEDAKAIAKKLLASEQVAEEVAVRKELEVKGYEEIVFNIQRNNVRHVANDPVIRHFRKNFRKIVVEELKWFKDNGSLNEFLVEVGVEFSKLKIKASVGKDALISQVIGAIEELDKTINIHIERLREWYGLYFPEMEREIKDHEEFVAYVSSYAYREKMPEKFRKIADDSVGIDLDARDVETMKSFAATLKSLYGLRRKLEKYLDELLKEVAPNLRGLAGTIVAAKLIDAAGGLEKLAKMPSSTIQLLGAEKALFRFLRGKGRSPKHGYIYLTPYIQNAPVKKRGRVARLLASKLSIAARVDYYSKGKELIWQKLKEELEEKIKEAVR